MRILIAEDDRVTRRMLEGVILQWGYDVAVADDGIEAWEALKQGDARMAILDWEMPGLDGAEICKRLREKASSTPTYVILLTSRNAKEDVVRGLRAGANDYVTKPFDPSELRARIEVGRTVTQLQATLAARVGELEAALAQVQQLQGLLPICSYCKKIRDDSNYWQRVEEYLSAHSRIQFSHGICPDCWQTRVEPELRKAGL